jgi:hypothetical protein
MFKCGSIDGVARAASLSMHFTKTSVAMAPWQKQQGVPPGPRHLAFGYAKWDQFPLSYKSLKLWCYPDMKYCGALWGLDMLSCPF